MRIFFNHYSFFPHFTTISEKTDITQIPEVSSALLKANRANAIHLYTEFDLEKGLES